MKKNVASQTVGIQMVSATDGSAFTGAVTCYVTGDAGTQAAGSVGSGACTHEGNGFHTYAPAQAETNYAHIAFTFTGTGAIPATIQVYPSFPQTGDSFALIGATGSGLTSLATQASVTAIDDLVDTEVAAIKTVVDSILVDTAEIGAAGAGLTALATAANLATVAGYLDTEIAEILADTNELQADWANGGRLDLILDARASQTSVDTVDTAVDAVKVQTDKLTFNVGNEVAANVESINNTAVIGVGTSGDKWRA